MHRFSTQNEREFSGEREGKINGKNILEYLMNSPKGGGNRSRDC